MPHFPAGECECGAALEDAADLGVAASHQIVDIPLETATLAAYVADQQNYYQQEKVHVAIRDGCAWDRERLRRTATIGLGRAVLSRLTDGTPWTVLCVNTDRPHPDRGPPTLRTLRRTVLHRRRPPRSVRRGPGGAGRGGGTGRVNGARPGRHLPHGTSRGVRGVAGSEAYTERTRCRPDRADCGSE